MRPIVSRTLGVLVAAGVIFSAPPLAQAEEAPVKEQLSTHIGWEVNGSTGGTVCTEAEAKTGVVCEPGKPTSEPGGFKQAAAVAVNDDAASPHYHHVYVVDQANYRVEEFNENGQLVGMFGWEVNATRDKEPGASQTEKNRCISGSGDICQAGVQGTAPGQLDNALSIAIDPASGNVYLAEAVFPGERLQAFTADGQFVLEIGRKVNQTTGGNICTAAEATKGVQCVAPAPGSDEAGTKEPDAFSFGKRSSDTGLLAFGPEGTLYVGENGRVQKLVAVDGKYEGELSLGEISAQEGSRVSVLAIDSAGNLYLVYREFYSPTTLTRLEGEHANVVYELSPAGAVLSQMTATAKEPGGAVEIMGLALDPTGRLGVTEFETYVDNESHVHSAYRGRLYDAISGHLRLITEFVDPGSDIGGNGVGIKYLTFDDGGNMFATDDYYVSSRGDFAQELLGYAPVQVAAVRINAPSGCVSGPDVKSNATIECGLAGEVNPEGVTETAAWFLWGPTSALGSKTPDEVICESSCGTGFVPIAASIAGLRPNQTVYDEVVATDAYVKLPEMLPSEETFFTTQTVAPRIVGVPRASFVRPFAADLSGEVNPENTNTVYEFQYAPDAACEAHEADVEHAVAIDECPEMEETNALTSSEYGPVETILEARGLRPATAYRYRLFARNDAGEDALGETGGSTVPEGTFTTGKPPVPEAVSGLAGDIGTTYATVSGAVNPDGAPAAYRFELGVDSGAATKFGVVFSGDAGNGTDPVSETLRLSALQPGTIYAFRIAVSSAYGTSYGAAIPFQTEGLPAVIQTPSVAQGLPMPTIGFPKKARRSVATFKCRRGHKLHKHTCSHAHHKSVRNVHGDAHRHG